METAKQLITNTGEMLSHPLLVQYGLPTVRLFFILYAASMAPTMPIWMTSFMKNVFIRIALLSLIGILANIDFTLAIVLAVVFVVGMNIMSGRGIFESFSEFKLHSDNPSGKKLISPKAIVYPGCEKMKLADLVAFFDGDIEKIRDEVSYTYQELVVKMKGSKQKDLLKAMSKAVGLPYNVDFNDETAPYIATLLIYRGFKISPMCSPPHDE